MRLRLLIVDDNSQFIKAASDLLQRQGAEVVGVASNGAEAVRLARELQPDGVLVDVELGPESGFDLALRLSTEYQQRVVLTSVHSETEFADLMATTLGISFIPKADLSARKITDALDDARRPD